MRVLWNAGSPSKEAIKKKYLKFVYDKTSGLTLPKFLPRHFVKEEKAQEEAKAYAMAIGGVTVVFKTKEGKYTFVPFSNDLMSNAYRMARAMGAEVCEDYHRWDL
jgi:hypothetical protein